MLITEDTKIEDVKNAMLNVADAMTKKDYEEMTDVEKIKYILSRENSKDFNGVNPGVRAIVREINKESNSKKKETPKVSNIKTEPYDFTDYEEEVIPQENFKEYLEEKEKKIIEESKKIKVSIFYDDDLDANIVRIFYDNLSNTKTFDPKFTYKDAVENWVIDVGKRIMEVRGIEKEELLNLDCVTKYVVMDENDSFKFVNMIDVVYKYLKVLNQINLKDEVPFGNHVEKLCSMLQNGELKGPNIVKRWGK